MLYWKLISIIKFFYKCISKIEYIGLENIPMEGGVVVSPNHVSNHDPFIVAIGIPREMSFLAKSEIKKIPIMNLFVNKLKIILINRGRGDMQAIKSTIDALKRGEAMMIFPQGTRLKTFEREQIKTGAFNIALKSGACIVPAYIDKKLSLFKKVTIRFGSPLSNEYLKKAQEDGQKPEDVLYEEIKRLSWQK